MFKAGETYSKNDLYRILQVPNHQQKGSWNTGYTKYKDEFYIFANIGVAGRTGHDYNNHWQGDDFIWFAKTRTNLNQPTIQALIHTNTNVHIFTRTDDRDPFTYKGQAKAKKYYNVSPVKIIWQFNKTELINIEKAWSIMISNAKEYFKTGESYYSPRAKDEYKVIKVTKDYITIKNLNLDAVVVNISFPIVKTAIEKFNKTNGILPRKRMHVINSIEDSIVCMLPILDWDAELRNIVVSSPYLNEQVEPLLSSINEAKNDDSVKTISRQLRVRRGQNKLRENLFIVYRNKCCVSGCDIKELLHACHIIPHAQTGNNSSTNAFLLRSDLHDLFDANLIGIDPKTLTISVKKSLSHSEYYKFNGIKISDRIDELIPNIDSLKHRWHLFNRSL